jgi:hypothetical protein
MNSIAMRAILRTLLVGLMLTAGGSIVRAGPLEDATAAGQKGDYATALWLLRPLAAQGSAQAQYKLGLMYYSGEGVTRDLAEAAKLFRRAADEGDEVAQSILGQMYSKGQGVQQNYVLAYMWLSLNDRSPVTAEKLRGVVAAMTPEQICVSGRLLRSYRCSARLPNRGMRGHKLH